ncbi:MAG: hypothetical protein KDE27_25960 [Planctomycetes bacterium]|nr:hypothetical protein [Planctomycetota bacterium]
MRPANPSDHRTQRARVARLLLGILALASTSAGIAAQEGYRSNFRFDIAGGFGRVAHETDGSATDGDTGGAFGRLRFEGVGDQGFGGGIRLEAWGSDDDLFVDEGFQAEEARASDLFAHFTYRFERGPFRMPARIGFMAHHYELENVASGVTTLEVDSFGPRFEVAPEYVFNRGDVVEFSVYGELGIAAAYSNVETSSFSNDFDSSSAFWFAEVGGRMRIEFAEFGLGFITHGIYTDESDTENGNFVRAFGADFAGVVFSAAIVF